LLPGRSPRDLRRMLKRMGINLEELEDIVKVEIMGKNRKIVINDPKVFEIKMGSQCMYQIVGTPVVEPIAEEVEVSEEDVEFIVSQTGVSKEKARKALIKAGGDLAEAILLIRENKV